MTQNQPESLFPTLFDGWQQKNGNGVTTYTSPDGQTVNMTMEMTEYGSRGVVPIRTYTDSSGKLVATAGNDFMLLYQPDKSALYMGLYNGKMVYQRAGYRNAKSENFTPEQFANALEGTHAGKIDGFLQGQMAELMPALDAKWLQDTGKAQQAVANSIAASGGVGSSARDSGNAGHTDKPAKLIVKEESIVSEDGKSVATRTTRLVPAEDGAKSTIALMGDSNPYTQQVEDKLTCNGVEQKAVDHAMSAALRDAREHGQRLAMRVTISPDKDVSINVYSGGSQLSNLCQPNNVASLTK